MQIAEMMITESNTIQLSIGLLVVFAAVITTFVVQQQKVKALERDIKEVKKALARQAEKLDSVTAWRERIKGASSVTPTGPLAAVRTPIAHQQHAYHHTGDPSPDPVPRAHTPILGVPFRVHETGPMRAAETSSDPEDSR